jgi:hypothetical protein
MNRYLGALLIMSVLGFAQNRFGPENAILRGFTISPTEHIMNELPDVVVLRVIKGRVMAEADQTAMPDVLVEVRKKDSAAKVLGFWSDEKGEFHFRRLPEGDYIFKVTYNGFQSVFGRLHISKRAPAETKFDIELKPGV